MEGWQICHAFHAITERVILIGRVEMFMVMITPLSQRYVKDAMDKT